jgi:DNA-binding transcriptional MerR regulator
MTSTLSIRQVAATTGLSVHTLRYYERIGLIDAVPRRHNLHRQYRQEDLRWIAFLLRLRSTGLPIRQMLRYAELRRRGNRLDSVSKRKALLAQHASDVEAQIEALQETLALLREKVALYAEMESALQAGRRSDGSGECA